MALSAMALRLIHLVCAAGLAAAAAAGDGQCEAGGCGGGGGSGGGGINPEGYFWRRRGGGLDVLASTPHSAPTGFAEGPTWVWPNELDEQVRHSPLIDDKFDIYIATPVRIRKFDPDGHIKWTWEAAVGEGKMSTSPALYEGNIYALSFVPPATAHMYAIDMETGRERWKARMDNTFMHADANSLFAYNGTILFPERDHLEAKPLLYGDDGNNQVSAVSTEDGKRLWSYTADDVLWNLMVSTPGDGTILFASQCGGAYRISWAGELIWRAGRKSPGHWCSCGGGTLGPNGLFYAEFNDMDKRQGVVSAIRVSDGSLMWERTWPMPYGGWQYPGVGRIAPNGRLAVLAPMGAITGTPRWPGLDILARAPDWLKALFYNQVYLKSSWVRHLMGVPKLPNALIAMDAETGETIWYVEAVPWDRYAMAGDEEKIFERVVRASSNPTREDAICLPDPQGIPLVAGDGTVYATDSHTGDLGAIRDANGDGVIDQSEMSIFKTGIGFLNSPSLAPGMLVAAPCWGPTYVFKEKATTS